MPITVFTVAFGALGVAVWESNFSDTMIPVAAIKVFNPQFRQRHRGSFNRVTGVFIVLCGLVLTPPPLTWVRQTIYLEIFHDFSAS